MSFEIAFVLICMGAMLAALVCDVMRPGMIMLSVVVIFLCAGIITPKEMLEGFSNKGMITVAMLFLVSEGIRRSGALNIMIKWLLPQQRKSLLHTQLRMLPAVSFTSAFLNNTPIVVIFAPIVKRWAERMKVPATKLLIPLSYATILGGMCTLIGTSTNLVVHGMVIDAGYEGFSMFELGKVGIFICIAGLTYLFFFSKRLLPESREDNLDKDDDAQAQNLHRVEVILGARFPGIKKQLGEFNFALRRIRQGGAPWRSSHPWRPRQDNAARGRHSDSLGRRSIHPHLGRLACVPHGVKRQGRGVEGKPRQASARHRAARIHDCRFFFVCVTTIIMAWTKIFPPKKYTKYISWDILITIACAFAISKAINNSGVAPMIARNIIAMTDSLGPYGLLAVLFIITNVFTELITNNAAAALSFPIALSVANELGVSPTPFFVVICMAASTSFCTPIGYQTNLIVQGVGGYKFTDFIKVGLPLNVIAFAISVGLIPLFWDF